MPSAPLLLGEFRRLLDERYRVAIPPPLAEPLVAESAACTLAKQRRGCLSLWSDAQWRTRLDADVELVRTKIEAGRLAGRIEEVQSLGRLLSTRHRPVELSQRGRLLVPEGFREFLGVEAGGELLIVGAAVCVELWKPEAWFTYVEENMPEFRRLLDNLSA